MAETLSLSGSAAPFIAVWQSAESNSVVYGRALNADGSAAADTFAIAPSAQSQRYPSIDTDGSNHLVCWMEQNVASNDWRVVTRVISNAAPVGVATTISQTNSFSPRSTACSFGTNYLVAWSADEGPYPYCLFPDYPEIPSAHFPGTNCCCGTVATNYWFAMVYGRMASPAGYPVGSIFPIFRYQGANTNPAVAFGQDRYLASSVNAFEGIVWRTSDVCCSFSPRTSRLQSLAADGSRAQYPIPNYHPTLQPRIGYGGGTFCVLSPWTNLSATVMLLASDKLEQIRITNFSRTQNGVLSVNGTVVSQGMTNRLDDLQISTNLMNWTPTSVSAVSNLTNQAHLFVRAVDNSRPCIENLRAITWAKDQWYFEKKRVNSDTPLMDELVGTNLYLSTEPHCPSGGGYTTGSIQTKPICTIVGHTLL